MLERLLGSNPFKISNRPTGRKLRLYLFGEDETRLYVGRTSITARSRRK